jgi:hypothetical protein
VLRARERALTPYFFVVFILYSHFESIKELGSASKACATWDPCVGKKKKPLTRVNYKENMNKSSINPCPPPPNHHKEHINKEEGRSI